jgi:hypothetical protein
MQQSFMVWTFPLVASCIMIKFQLLEHLGFCIFEFGILNLYKHEDRCIVRKDMLVVLILVLVAFKQLMQF